MFAYWPSFYEARRTQGKNKANIDSAAILIKQTSRQTSKAIYRLIMQIYQWCDMACNAIPWKHNSAVSGLFNLAISDNPNRQLAFIAALFQDPFVFPTIFTFVLPRREIRENEGFIM